MQRNRRETRARWRQIAGAGLLTAVAGLAPGCATAPQTQPGIRPDWVDRPSAYAPADVALTASATGAGPGEAADAALARLAQQIAVHVESQERSEVSYTNDTDGGHRQQDRYEATVQLDSAVLLLAADVVETWHDPETGSVAALAVLDRAAATRGYDLKIEALADQAGDQFKSAQRTGSPWAGYLRLGAALAAAEQHDRLLQVRTLVAPRNAAPTAAYILAPAIAARWRRAGAAISAVVELTDGAPREFESIVQGALQDAGVATGGPEAAAVRATLSYHTAARPFHQRTDHVVEWRVGFALIDGQTGHAAEGLSLEGSGWGATETQATRAAFRDAQRRVALNLPPFLARISHQSLLRPRKPPAGHVAIGTDQLAEAPHESVVH